MKNKELSAGKKAALYRSRQLTEVEWIPLGDVPVFMGIHGPMKILAGKKVKGMIYSSTEPTDKFITENISFETFQSIVNNPDSALYNKDLDGHNNSWAYFGIVCNGLARYALNIPERYSTKRWYDISGMRKIAEPEGYSVEEMEICDILYAYGNGRNHVSLITDILRGEDGKVCAVEVSEAIRPSCKRQLFKPEDFYEKYKLFGLCRYDYIDSVPMPDEYQDKFVPTTAVSVTPSVAVDYGTKTNYRTCEDVVISAFGDGENVLEIIKDNEVIETLKFDGRGKTSRRFERGYYVIKHKTTGETVEFCVTEPKISHYVKDGVLHVNANSCDEESVITHLEFREIGRNREKNPENKGFYSPKCAALSKVEHLTDEEKASGVFARKIPDDGVHFKVCFKNKYGVWTHTMIKI